MSLRYIAFLAVLLGCAAAYAQDDDLPDAQDLAESAAKRFPQPVRVGDLRNRWVIEPVESQPTLGRVHGVVKEADGTIAVVIDYGGFLGFNTRQIAVPVNAMVLLGHAMEVVDYDTEQLKKFPTFSPVGTKPLPSATIIRVGLARPSH
ncbi:MAG TPA: hypothetical protein VMF32_26265 [Xanthobacteraceae bacterium]|nr:hypothetical protein [Xanthobacteraceae bacterium]